MGKTTVALVGSDSLLGREIRDIVATSAPDLELRLMAADQERAGTLTRVGDEPTIVAGLDARGLVDVRAVFLAGSRESAGKALGLLAGTSATAIDLTAVAEKDPTARLRAPMIEQDAAKWNEDAASGVGQAGPEGAPPANLVERAVGRRKRLPHVVDRAGAIHVVAHPTAIALALFLRRLHCAGAIRRSVIQIFAPASEHGTEGVEELQQQTISLLSFKNMPRAVFDTQSAFNLLARYGEEAPVPLEDCELRIERHLATLLAMPAAAFGRENPPPMPSLRLIQAPVFHGYSFSAWVEFENNPGIAALESGLVSGHIEVRGAKFEPPTNVGQAGQGGVSLGAIAPDRNNPEAAWFWGVADNLRLAAENAVAVARELI